MPNDASADSRVLGSLRAVDDAGVVRIEGHFDAELDDLWSAVTDPGRLARWLGEVEGDLRLGGEFRARFFATGWEGIGRVEACEPPVRLVIVTKSEGEPDCIIEVTLTPDGGQTAVAFEDRGLPLEQIAAYGAGDQVLVEGLAAYLAGSDRCDPQARWRELHPIYQDLAATLELREPGSIS